MCQKDDFGPCLAPWQPWGIFSCWSSGIRPVPQNNSIPSDHNSFSFHQLSCPVLAFSQLFYLLHRSIFICKSYINHFFISWLAVDSLLFPTKFSILSPKVKGRRNCLQQNFQLWSKTEGEGRRFKAFWSYFPLPREELQGWRRNKEKKETFLH